MRIATRTHVAGLADGSNDASVNYTDGSLTQVVSCNPSALGDTSSSAFNYELQTSSLTSAANLAPPGYVTRRQTDRH